MLKVGSQPVRAMSRLNVQYIVRLNKAKYTIKISEGINPYFLRVKHKFIHVLVQGVNVQLVRGDMVSLKLNIGKLTAEDHVQPTIIR